ncbi:MAG: folate-binding protein [Sphingomonas sp.]|nr:folate-binding protein [Sphingomonas sp.]
MAGTTLTDRAIVRLSGDGVRDFLQGLVTSDVLGELPVWAGLLTPQGKCLFDFVVWPDDRNSANDLLIDCEAAAADDLIKRLSIYRLRRPIGIESDPTLAVHWSPDSKKGVPDPRLGALGSRWLQSCAPAKAGAQSGEAAEASGEAAEGSGEAAEASGEAAQALRAPGLLPSQEHKWLEHRLRLGVTEGRAELGDILWLECNAVELNGVSFSKGCFVGQENTARMNWRSKINRRLVVVATDQPGPRTRVTYPELGLAVEHRRVDDLAGALISAWLQPVRK